MDPVSKSANSQSNKSVITVIIIIVIIILALWYWQKRPDVETTYEPIPEEVVN